MPKKRALIPFYGKLNQRLEQTGQALLKAGQPEAAEKMFVRSKEVYAKRKGKARAA